MLSDLLDTGLVIESGGGEGNCARHALKGFSLSLALFDRKNQGLMGQDNAETPLAISRRSGFRAKRAVAVSTE